MTELQQRIVVVWKSIASKNDKDVSAEYLSARVIDSFKIQCIDIDESDVSNALNAQAENKKEGG